MEKAYPDISGILSAKAQRRLSLAALSWEEKVAIIEQMQILLPKGQWRDKCSDEGVPGHQRALRHRVAADTASRRQE
jgi:hypothetical protein